MAGPDLRLAKHAPNGELLWSRSIGGPQDRACGLALDSAQNPHVAGRAVLSTNSIDYVVVKYSALGAELWRGVYDGTNHFQDIAVDMALDGSGNVYVTGHSLRLQGDDRDIATVKFDAAGNRAWVSRYSGASNRHDTAAGLALDSSGNVFVVGNTLVPGQGDFATDIIALKYDNAGNELWRRIYDPVNAQEEAVAVALNHDTNLVILGSTFHNPAKTPKPLLLNYDTGGELLWSETSSDPDWIFSGEPGEALAIDPHGNVIVAARYYPFYYDSDWIATLLLKYDYAGRHLWTARYICFGSALALTTDAAANIYLTRGVARQPDAPEYHLATLRFDPAGQRLWTIPSLPIAVPGAILTDSNGDVFVAAAVSGGSALIKYSQNNRPGPPRITEPPASQSVAPGASANFTVTAEGSMPLAYQWLKQGAPIPGATNAFLARANLQPADRVNYSVQVGNSLGVTISPEAALAAPARFFPGLSTLNSELTLSLQGDPARAYRVETSSDLAAWTYATNFIPYRTNVTFRHRPASPASPRFYRAVTHP